MPPIPASYKRSVTPSQESPWKAAKVKIQGDERWATVEGKVLGKLAVHSDLDVKDRWTVSQLTTGLRVVSVDTEADALRIGEYLWERFCLALRLETKEEIGERMPERMKQWCRDCKNAARWIDPKPYEEDR